MAGLLWAARRRLALGAPAFTSVFQGALRFNTYVALAGAAALHGDAGLTIAAAIAMGSVRAMLSNISFVYTHYYHLTTAVGGLLISVPPLCGFLSSIVAARH